MPRTLLVLALAFNALRYGVRRQINWPIAALLAVLVLSPALGELHPRLTPLLMLEGFAVLALPFAFTSVVLAPGSRRGYAAVIALLPLLSALVGALMSLGRAGADLGLPGLVREVYRLGGALDNPEAVRDPGLRRLRGGAARGDPAGPAPTPAGSRSLNLVLVILSGTRMAIFAAAVLLRPMAACRRTLREMLLRQRWLRSPAGWRWSATVVLYWPSLQHAAVRGRQRRGHTVGPRRPLELLLEEFLLSPLFGRGLGVGYVAGADWLTDLTRNTPHNEYLHLLVAGGAVGLPAAARRRSRCGTRQLLPRGLGQRPPVPARAGAGVRALRVHRRRADLLDRARAVRLSRRDADPLPGGSCRRAGRAPARPSRSARRAAGAAARGAVQARALRLAGDAAPRRGSGLRGADQSVSTSRRMPSPMRSRPAL